ncbi:alcohol dehydrogenase catalytic domain-containing protein [Nocardioides zeae]|uniref:Alcohol dehydrogenase catalytic domain-containing protein n=1 Tax=Nocardioides imazamoxiresistens TaxID=3231893 RepID=A0ABU3PTI9_9ACTN|nr:alcohol dehydrogenase catalytic domain-containing protein [Nocardioides zeae]MDT9592206.1 alcohol dehydrogenase catalytic domain-containing protein [Nocardioides zeae]
MRAVQYRTIGAGPELVEVSDPEPGPGQVLLAVRAAGLCHSDLGVMSRSADAFPYGPLPLTLGHESAGEVVALGAGVRGVELGERVVVYGPWGCGRCAACARGRENGCAGRERAGVRMPGLGGPGALADLQLVDHARHLVPLGDLDPVAAAGLADAALTPYSAIRSAAPVLTPGSTALVIGIGGLGHVAVQLLKALSPVRVVAVDRDERRLALATECGADVAVLADDADAELATLLPGGAALVLDLVGSAATTTLAARTAASGGEVRVVGAGPGAVPIGYRTTAFDVGARFSFWGGLDELHEVVALARAGRVRVHTETVGLEDVVGAYGRLAAGEVLGRVVAVP